MSFLLAVETSTRYGGVAGFKNDKLIQVKKFAPDKPASELLIPHIRDMLDDLSMHASDISAFAVSIGPGSFTGLRVGLSAVKTLAVHLSIPVFPISTLLVLAKAAGPQCCPVAAIMDARKHEIYGAYFSTEPSFTRLSDDEVMPIEKFLTLSPSENLYLIGDAIDVYRDEIERGGLRVTYAPPDACHPSPVYVGEAALSGEIPPIAGEDIYQLMPVYLRKSEAEVNWEKKFGLQSR
ncbi:MAG: tRNA (adenosine(37)-N6)-threonylcarbamoyltransferase complex dimerization subunit type 1 TsaB [bacterium]